MERKQKVNLMIQGLIFLGGGTIGAYVNQSNWVFDPFDVPAHVITEEVVVHTRYAKKSPFVLLNTQLDRMGRIEIVVTPTEGEPYTVGDGETLCTEFRTILTDRKSGGGWYALEKPILPAWIKKIETRIYKTGWDTTIPKEQRVYNTKPYTPID